jgi:hypothetical protein
MNVDCRQNLIATGRDQNVADKTMALYNNSEKQKRMKGKK